MRLLSQSQIAVLAELQRPRSISEIARKTEYSTSQISTAVSHLESIDLVTARRDGREKVVRRTQTAVSRALDDFTTRNRGITIQSLYSEDIQRVCWFLDEGCCIDEMTRRLEVSKERVQEAIDTLQQRAMVGEEDGMYQLTSNVSALSELSQAISTHLWGERVRQFAPGARVVWASPSEVLVQSRTADGDGYDIDAFNDEWQITGLAKYRDYDLRFLLAAPPILWRSDADRSPSVEEIACHTVRAVPEYRRAAYTTLLLIQEGYDPERLQREGIYYDIPEITGLHDLIVSRSKNSESDLRWMPAWETVVRYAEQYDVSLKHATGTGQSTE